MRAGVPAPGGTVRSESPPSEPDALSRGLASVDPGEVKVGGVGAEGGPSRIGEVSADVGGVGFEDGPSRIGEDSTEVEMGADVDKVSSDDDTLASAMACRGDTELAEFDARLKDAEDDAVAAAMARQGIETAETDPDTTLDDAMELTLARIAAADDDDGAAVAAAIARQGVELGASTTLEREDRWDMVTKNLDHDESAAVSALMNRGDYGGAGDDFTGSEF